MTHGTAQTPLRALTLGAIVTVIASVPSALAWAAAAPGSDVPSEAAKLGQLGDVGSMPNFDTFRKASILMTARLTGVQAGPVGMSHPPMYTHRLQLTPVKVFRGSVKPGAPLTAHNVARQMREPKFPQGKTCLVVLSLSRGSYRVGLIKEATPELLKSAQMAASFPLGWKVVDGKPVSPWTVMGSKAWPKDVPVEVGQLVCGKTGRPAGLVGAEIRFEVAKVPPPKDIKWTNPDGDGEYRITLTNPTDRPLTVAALWSDGEKTLWNESLVIICQDKARVVPTAVGIDKPAKPTVLQPGQSVSTVVNALQLDNVQWPRGGYRIEFQFCLGEKSSVQSFYYMSRHHDKIRQQARAALK